MVSLYERLMQGEDVPVIDMHGHVGPYAGISLPAAGLDAMIAGMDQAGVEAIVLSPHSALDGDTREGNQEMLEAVLRYPGRVYGYVTVNPNFPDAVEPELDRYLGEPGVVGVKIHPEIHKAAADSPRYAPMWERLNAHDGLVLAHTWGQTGLCGVDTMRRIARAYPEVRLLLGHSCYNAWEGAIALAAEHENVYLELTAAAHAYGLIEWMCREAGADKVVYGTDYPWFAPFLYIGFVASSRIRAGEIRKILYGNARRLLAEQGVDLA